MIKVNYAKDGKILGFYPNDIEYSIIPEPYVEISERVYQKIIHNVEQYRIKNSKLIDISKTDDYIYSQRIYEMAHKATAYKKQISDIEFAQNRLIREYIIEPSSEKIEKIRDIDLKISKLRDELSLLVF